MRSLLLGIEAGHEGKERNCVKHKHIQVFLWVQFRGRLAAWLALAQVVCQRCPGRLAG